MKKVVVFTGAGISAESGLATFRDKDGLWDKYNLEDISTYSGFENNPTKVLNFYNQRRLKMINAKPNKAHFALNKLCEKYELTIITQNIDDLHEKSGSERVIHLHGKLNQAKSIINDKIYEINGAELNVGDLCELGAQLRPNVVWFGEEVENMDLAINLVMEASIFIIIGTSLNVFPAASLIDNAVNSERIILIDLKPNFINGVEIHSGNATDLVPKIIDEILNL